MDQAVRQMAEPGDGDGLADGVSVASLEAYFDEVLPIYRLLGLRLTALAPGRAEVRLQSSPQVVRPGGGVAGPVMFAMADVGLYAAIFTLRGILPMAVTSDLGLHFLRAARSPEIRCLTEITKAGRRMAYADARLLDRDGRLVARASGSYAPADGRHACRTMSLTPQNPEFEKTVRGVFARQGLMEAFGVQIHAVSPGACTLSVGFHGAKAKLQGSIQGALLGAMADTAASLAALTLVPRGHGIVTLEYKVSFLEPALGDKVVARAKVRRAGRTITLVEADTLAVAEDGYETLCAVSMHTLMRLDPPAAKAAAPKA